jgi:FemAB-related protein (PEP-CTERM system-associated)
MGPIPVRVTLVDDAEASEWDSYVASSENAEIYHLFAWKRHFESVFGHDCYYLIARDDKAQTVGVLPLVHQSSRLFGNFLISVPCFNYCGILAHTDQAHAALVDEASRLARELGAGHVELRHRESKSLELPLRSDKVSMLLALPGEEDLLWRGFSSKLRAQIRRPQKEGAVCVSGGAELLDDFYAVFAHNMRDLGTPVFPKRMFADILARFPEHARIFVVRMKDRPVAAGYTLGHRGTLEIPSASSLRAFNRYSPNMLLYWTVLQYAVSQGFKTFDFGRTSRDSGPYRFKKQWGAEATGLSWHYILQEGKALPRINPDNPKYRLAVNLWRRLPVPLANLIGPQVVKHLP